MPREKIMLAKRHRSKTINKFSYWIIPKCRINLWFVFLSFFMLWYFLFYVYNWSSTRLTEIENLPIEILDSKIISNHDTAKTTSKFMNSTNEQCLGRYIFVHQLPKKFNDEIIEQCVLLNKWIDMCRYVMNIGLGPNLGNPQRIFLPTGWYSTSQFSLEIIFHNRLKRYDCLTNDSSKASVVFVPYYAGLDVSRYLWGFNYSVRDANALELAKFLGDKPEWKVMFGHDHFLVAGRITWDFRRGMDDDSAWGNKLMLLPEFKNLTILTIESSPWNLNDFGIPYPTYFHPSTDNEVHTWQNKMRRQKRKILFSFVGGARPHLENSIREEIISQCKMTNKKCRMIECNHNKKNKCQNPVNVMKLFQSSIFCLQPSGDSFTRRSTFDSILAGCIPVFFSPGSAYVQYIWHLPKEFNKYSVLIPENEVKSKNVWIEKLLSEIPKHEVMAMREEVIKLIPKIVYANPRSKLETHEDAFDLTLKGLIKRVEKIRREIRDGAMSSLEIDEEKSWKYNLFGIVGTHEWDHYFSRTNRSRYDLT